MTWDLRDRGDCKLSENDAVGKLLTILIGGFFEYWRSFVAGVWFELPYDELLCSIFRFLSKDQRSYLVHTLDMPLPMLHALS